MDVKRPTRTTHARLECECTIDPRTNPRERRFAPLCECHLEPHVNAEVKFHGWAARPRPLHLEHPYASYKCGGTVRRYRGPRATTALDLYAPPAHPATRNALTTRTAWGGDNSADRAVQDGCCDARSCVRCVRPTRTGRNNCRQPAPGRWLAATAPLQPAPAAVTRSALPACPMPRPG